MAKNSEIAHKERSNWAETIRQAVNADGRSRYAIANAAGIGENILSRFMAGKGLSLETANKLAHVLGLTLQNKSAKRPERAS